jgi:hypothetical protein
MKIFYKKDINSMLYAKCTFDGTYFWIVSGIVGSVGQATKYEINKDFQTKEQFEQVCVNKFLSEGYKDIEDIEMGKMAIQYPVKGLFGESRSLKFRDKFIGTVDKIMLNTGIGLIDGFDIGVLLTDRSKKVLNIYADVVDEKISLEVLLKAIKENELDFKKVKIGYSKNGEEEYKLVYSNNPTDDNFSI